MRLSTDIDARITKGRREWFSRGYEIPEGSMRRLVMAEAGRATPEDGLKVSIWEQVMQNLHDTARTP